MTINLEGFLDLVSLHDFFLRFPLFFFFFFFLLSLVYRF